jgi:hypothetical protein
LREWDAIAAGDLTLFAHQAAYKNASFNLIGTSRAYDYYFRAYMGQSLYSASVQANTTANLTVKLNLSVPPYQNGTYSYFFNASEGSSGTLCVGCLNYSGSINLSAYGNHTINVFSRSNYYEPQAYSFNGVQYFTNITLFFLDEKTNAAFNVSGTDGLMLYTICVDETIYEYNVKVANVTNVSNYLVICNFTKLKSVVSYPAASYYRSLIPNQSDKNVTFYLIDLYTDTAVAIALQFEGLDAFINPQIIIENANRIIIKDLPDMENKIVTYLLKNYEYQVIVQSASTYKVLGNLIADAAGTKFIRLNPVDVQMSYLQAFDYIFTAYNISETAIRANYVDLSAALSTVNLTIYNHTIWGAVLWSSEVAGTNAVNFTWNTPIDNKTSYVTLMTISHNTFGTLRQTQELQVGSGHYGSLIDITGDLPASVKGEVDTWKKIGVVMFLVVLALLFSAANAKLGVIITGIFALFFWKVGWLDITSGAITLIALTVVLNAITKKRT